MIEEIAMALDPNMQTFQGILGRECTIVKNGKYVKDFSYLGRPVKEVVYLDFTNETVPFHQDNVIVLPEFDGSTEDRALYDIMPFLKHLAQVRGDVRDEIRLYGQDTTASNFNRMRAQRRTMINQNKQRGLSGVVTNLSKAQGSLTDEQRALREEMNLNTFSKRGN